MTHKPAQCQEQFCMFDINARFWHDAKSSDFPPGGVLIYFSVRGRVAEQGIVLSTLTP